MAHSRDNGNNRCWSSSCGQSPGQGWWSLKLTPHSRRLPSLGSRCRLLTVSPLPHSFAGALVSPTASEDLTSADLSCPRADVDRLVSGPPHRKMGPRDGEVRHAAGLTVWRGLLAGRTWMLLQNFIDRVTIRPHPLDVFSLFSGHLLLCCSPVLGQLVRTRITLAWQGREWCGGETPGSIPTPGPAPHSLGRGGCRQWVPWEEK